jgi:hypothetical protein
LAVFGSIVGTSSIGDISANDRLSVLEDWVRFREGVELEDAAIAISSTGGSV